MTAKTQNPEPESKAAANDTLTIGQNDTINSLKLAPSASNQILALGAHTMTINNGGHLLTVNQTTAGTYAGVIAGNGGFILGSSSTNALTLSGINTYIGATTVSAGRLVVSGSIGNSAVTVSGAGTILATDAAASFGSTLAINSGAILAAGGAGAAGTATVASTTTFNNGSIFSWDINSTGTSYDRLISSSLVDDNADGGAVFRIVAADATFADTFWDTTRTWADIFTNGTTAIASWASIFSSTVSVVNSSFSPISPVGGNFSVAGNTLTWTAVPEPTSALAGLLLGAGLLRRRRK